MKKLIALLLAAVCVFGLCACKNEEAPKQALDGLSDALLYEAVLQELYRIEDAHYYNVEETLKALNKQQKVVYLLNAFDMEMQNGGLCQFLMNAGTDMAPLVGDALKTVGADAHMALYDGFLKNNGIDEQILTAFSSASIDSFEEQYSSYPFEGFDDAYRDLPPVSDLIVAYIRDNISAFS